MDETEWTRGLGEGFCEYFYGERGGDYQLHSSYVKFNEFEKRYIKAIFRERCMYDFVKGPGLSSGIDLTIEYNGMHMALVLLFGSFNNICGGSRGSSNTRDHIYLGYSRHPIKELITNNYPRWRDKESHKIIQDFILDKTSACDEYAEYTLPELMHAAAMSMHPRLGAKSELGTINQEMLSMIRDHLLSSKYNEVEIDRREYAYLESLE